MDSKKKQILLKAKKDFVKDLDVIYILDDLFSRKALSVSDFDHIINLKKRDERVRFLIDILVQNGDDNAFIALKDSLAKDHRWLWEKLDVVDMSEMQLNESFEDCLSMGDVPRLPEHYVRRTEVEQKVTNGLKDLSRHNVLVLHGMSGCGKTTVATAVLRSNPELVQEKFNGIVFWFSLGDCKTDDDIVAQQNKLYRKASSINPFNSTLNLTTSRSSISSIADSSMSSYDWTWGVLKDKLKSQFTEPNLKECLIVLDEVNDRKVVDAFDIGCKLLVTTRDMDVVENLHPQIIKIEDQFKESESLQLFAYSIGVDVSKLPSRARKIHEKCKGSPFHIGLIGADLAENRERIIHDSSQWNKYLEKKHYFMVSAKNTDNRIKTIEVCVNSLGNNILSYFRRLSILPTNVKVSAKVISKLWNKSVPEVETIMNQLKNKSLVLKLYDKEQTNYVFEIRDLIMDYLHICTTEKERKTYHIDFLRSYQYENVDSPSEIIENDGYIAFYIGYHILHTEHFELFTKMYLDLKFLGNKVRLTGASDVILDLQNYSGHIAHEKPEIELLNKIVLFFHKHGTDLHRYPYTDIVQSVLQNEAGGALLAAAETIAQSNCARNQLYFEFSHEQNPEEIIHSMIYVKEQITAVCFLRDYVLVGTRTGVIEIYHNKSTEKLKKDLPGTNSAVEWIGSCPENPLRVASLDQKGNISLWYIDDLDVADEDVLENKFEELLNNNGDYGNITILPILGEFISCRWANNSETLIANSSKIIVLYNSVGDVLKLIDLGRDQDIICCISSNNDRFLIMATLTDTYNVQVMELETKERVVNFDEVNKVLDLLTVPGSDRIIVLKEREVVEHEIQLSRILYSKSINFKCRTIISHTQIKEGISFLSMVVNSAGTLLFLSTDESRIICVNLNNNTYAFDLENKRGNVTTMCITSEMYYDVVSTDVLLTGTGDTENSVKVWYLDPTMAKTTQTNGKTRLTKRFDVSFVNAMSPHTPISGTSSGTNTNNNTPTRHQSFTTNKMKKTLAKKTLSLDRHALKPLNLKGIGNEREDSVKPLLAVVDDKNNIQILRGRRTLAQITEKQNEKITKVKISPCGQYIIYAVRSGLVKKYDLMKKVTHVIMDVNSPIQYLNFVHSGLLVAAGRNRCLMAYRFTEEGKWTPKMLQTGNNLLGSQELLDDLQGVRKNNVQQDAQSISSSLSSGGSKERIFPNTENGNLFQSSGLVYCIWLTEGLITVEYNACIKLWDQHFKLKKVLNARRIDAQVNWVAHQKNMIILCDESTFQVFELKRENEMELCYRYERTISRIASCDLTADGRVLALGLDSGDVVVWDISQARQLRLLKLHKTKVQWCSFSPVPERLFAAAARTPGVFSPTVCENTDDDQPPLVLVTMASEIVWWNITFLIKNTRSAVRNALTPLNSPCGELTPKVERMQLEPSSSNVFSFEDSPHKETWKDYWKNKTCKEGSTKKEVLACIKLSGTNAKKLCQNDNFSCFVTVDDVGQVHIMNIMKPNS